jgi:hypothetical protein
MNIYARILVWIAGNPTQLFWSSTILTHQTKFGV